MSKFKGVFTALATPFYHGKLDISSFQRLVDHQLRGEIQGLVVNGTTAESPCLSSEEVEILYKTTRELVGKDFPLVLGTGSNCTSKTIKQTKWAQELGADAALVVTPYYNKPTQEGLLGHFKAVAESTEIPVILYNVPARTITRIEVETIEQLAKSQNIIAIKDATGDMSFGQKTIEQVGSDFLVTSGDDDSFLNLSLLGGQGVTSVLSNLCPYEVVELFKKSSEKDESCLNEFSDKFGSLQKCLGVAPNPVPIKQALHEYGLFKSPEVRLPLVTMSQEKASDLAGALKEVSLSDKYQPL